ncbi:homoserine kinase [Kineococcus terrestris]|uniref:homoserine kinase n=1 Tax=Kineococcus terrestris TaxID=2044856 RepID=UPI004039D80E
MTGVPVPPRGRVAPAEPLRRLPQGAAARVSVPATSANLGPGFDAFGLALEVRDTVEARALAPGEGLVVRVEGEGAGRVPTDGRHLVVRVLRDELAAHGVEAPDLHLLCRNAVPHGRGLGSSASAIVAGLAAAHGLLAAAGEARGGAAEDAAVRERLLSEATRLEGHPDNAAPAVVGGFTIAWTRGDDPAHPQAVRTVRLDVHEDVRALVCVPDEELATSRARALLPATVPHADAALTAGRAGLLVHALTRDPSLLLDATEERLHQAQRAPAMPATADLLARLRGAGLPAVVSGAGPSALVLAPADRAAEVSALAGASGGWRVRECAVAAGGVTWEVLRDVGDLRDPGTAVR